jgi:protein arginine N-methyltransferase 1
VIAIDLTPETVLQIAPGLRTRWNADGHVLVDAPVGTIVDIGPDGYAILSLFSRPLSLGAAVERLEQVHGGSTHFAPTMSVINMLIEESALISEGETHSPSGWADPVEHARMLHDDRRTRDFIAGVSATVRPGDVVLEVGTGSGVLAVAAARAGARRVYAVEASDIADVAERVFAVNGVEDRVTLVPGWSRQIELPEPADVLVAEVIGNEPFEEEILETTLDARRRLLAPNARLVPNALTVMARPVFVSESEIRQRTFGRPSVDRWLELYGIDFQPLLDVADTRPLHTLTEGETVSKWCALGPPVRLVCVDLATFETPSLAGRADLTLYRSCELNAIALTFRAELGAGLLHEFDPWRWPASSWATSVWVLPEPLRVEPPTRLRVQYHRRRAGVDDGLTCEVVRGESA